MGIKTQRFARIFEIKGLQVLYLINKKSGEIDVVTEIGHRRFCFAMNFEGLKKPEGSSLKQVLETLTEQDAKRVLEDAFQLAVEQSSATETYVCKACNGPIVKDRGDGVTPLLMARNRVISLYRRK